MKDIAFMLLTLSLRDFVLVEQLHLDFQTGFTVLTGETGAGKSLTLDALSLLLGDKADYTQVRHGAKEAQLSALFDLSHHTILLQQLRNESLLPEDSEELAIRRIIDSKGKSRSFINNQAATLAQLKQIGSQLIDIHGQNTHHSLNKESAQRTLLDNFAGQTALAMNTKHAYQQWQNSCDVLKKAQQQADNLAVERDRLEWQLNELEQLHLQPNEWQQLNHSYDSLAHAAELLQAANAAQEHISGENGIQSLVYRCQKLLSPLSRLEKRFRESLDMLSSVEAELSEIASNLNDAAHRIDINPIELTNQEQRLRELMTIARKYRIEPEHLPDKYQEIQNTLLLLEASTDIDALQKQVEHDKAHYHMLAKKLSTQRHRAAIELAEQTTAHMQTLAMKGAQFHIELIPCAASAYGLEQVQFQVTANKGNPLRPLNKVASGGELARISLSLQVVTSQYTPIPTLIFDEVDTGIGGSVAETIGRALRLLGTHHQVLAVTHLPQVAAYGEHHWQVKKHQQQHNTISTIQILDTKGRTEEIARMLGGAKITATTRKHAAEMLRMASEH